MTTPAAAQGCTLVACPNPMQPAERVFCHVPAGQTIAEMIGPYPSYSMSVEIGGREVPRELWARTRPKPGQTLHVVVFPQGGNGGKWVRLVATVVLMYFTYGASGWAAGAASAFGGSAAVWGAAIMLVGQLALTPMVGQAREVTA